MPAGPTARMAVLRYLRHPLTIEIDFADAFYPREHVINSLAAEAHQFRADDARHEITREIENFLRRGAVEPLAKNRRHRASERLHFWTERHADMCLPILIHMQINAHCIGALLVFPHVDEIKMLPPALFTSFRIIRIRNERLAPLIFGKQVEEFNNLVQLAG